MKVNIHKESQIELTHRVEMLGSMFDCPISDKLSIDINAELPLEERKWNVGLIVGPSGSGKTLLLNEQFGKPEEFAWKSRSVIDDFADELSMESIASVCSSVGFNTIPSWLRPYDVLSNGEKFRCEIARRILSIRSPCVVDEFSSVVDRQVAQITSHAVQKYIRENNKQLVAASCHYDILNWLQPDWTYDTGSCIFTWRSLQCRPPVNVSISRVGYQAWNIFSKYHYMTNELNKAARCYGLFVTTGTGIKRCGERIRRGQEDGPTSSGVDTSVCETEVSSDRNSESSTVVPEREPVPNISGCPSTDMGRGRYPDVQATRQGGRIASFLGVLHRPHPRVDDIIGVSRVVTLPDWQGLGLAMCLVDTVASAYKAMGKRFHQYPNHPAMLRSYQRSRNWIQIKESGVFSPRRGSTSTVRGFGGKRCGVFLYVGQAMNPSDAKRLIEGE